MIKARLSSGVIILGLKIDNIRLLKEGKPIPLHLAELGGHDEILIMYGETPEAIIAELEAGTGTKIPEQWKKQQVHTKQ